MTLSWQSDAHGTYNLITADGAHVYVQARRPYCDRGHWEVGFMGVAGWGEDQPSYYYHRLDTAIEAAELWLAKARGHAVRVGGDGEGLPPEAHADWTVGPKGYTWAPAGASLAETTGPVVFTVGFSGDETDPVWTLEAEGLVLDHADRFPRQFLRLAHAIDEAQCIAQWRLRQVPVEHPDRIDRPDQAVAPAVAHALSAAPRLPDDISPAAVPPLRRPKY